MSFEGKIISTLGMPILLSIFFFSLMISKKILRISDKIMALSEDGVYKILPWFIMRSWSLV